MAAANLLTVIQTAFEARSPGICSARITQRMKPFLAALLATAIWQPLARAVDTSQPLGEPQLERPTLHSLGVYWIIQGDDNKNASVQLAYRKAGAVAWRPGADLWRVERGANIMEKF